MDKFIYDMREQTDLFREEGKEVFPESQDLDREINALTNEQRISWMVNILNRYGEEGWEFVTIIMSSKGLPLYIFKKKVYKGKD